MANYHLNISYGRVGKGGPHIDYILGQNKYVNKENEIKYTNHNLPNWCKSPKEFWVAADDNERINGTVYKEIRISLPNELSHEKNIELLNEFIDTILEGKYHYSVSIHSKESSYKKDILNTHAHIMFSPRELDGIERNKDIFFKRSNAKSPERGGCKKNTSWNNVEKLLEIRKIWEDIQNKYLENEKSNERVSCETLEKQREIALEKGDHLLAESLDRNPIHINGALLKKPEEKLSEDHKHKLESFKLNREIKELKDEILKLERLEAEKSLKKDAIKEIDLELNSFSDSKYQDILDTHEKLEGINVQILKVEHELLSSFNMEKNRLDSLNLLLKNLNNDKLNLEKYLDQFEETIQENEFKVYAEEKLKNSFNTMFNIFNQSNYEIKKAEKILKNIPRQLENLETTSLNILTKGEYSKLKRELDSNESNLTKYTAYYNHRVGSEKELNFFKKEIERLSESNKVILSQIEKIKSDYSTPEMKNKKIRIEKSIESKLLKEKELQESILLDKKIIVLIIRKKLIKIDERDFECYLSKVESERFKSHLKASKSSEIYNYFKNMKFEDIERLALNSLSKGRYFKAMKEYEVLNNKRIELNREKDSYLTLSKKLLHLGSLSRVNRELKSVNEALLKLEKEFKEIQTSIGDKKLYEEISKINNLRETITKRYYKQSNMFREKSELNEFFIKETNKLKKDLDSEKDISNRFTKASLKTNYINLRGKILGNYLVDFEIEKKKRKSFEMSF
ncbi:MobA/MobL family protein [Cetobacterium sp. 2G large]|uniref:MobA/MobL family protein n=1 Tax=Cetobacterium sp. 2G large TaxID=2759680 RepID=UPI00163C43E7|nr:MobA/MobL family protein [Cetobacterium sp. 2G large]MBC2852421.1 MobA/MobL family protein [Cetobacterium sp. 2G large]